MPRIKNKSKKHTLIQCTADLWDRLGIPSCPQTVYNPIQEELCLEKQQTSTGPLWVRITYEAKSPSD